jgi:hypothetical protein
MKRSARRRKPANGASTVAPRAREPISTDLRAHHVPSVISSGSGLRCQPKKG